MINNKHRARQAFRGRRQLDGTVGRWQLLTPAWLGCRRMKRASCASAALPGAASAAWPVTEQQAVQLSGVKPVACVAGEGGGGP